MFSRLLLNVYICPKCQCNGFRQGRDYITKSVQKRWQSSAAHAAQAYVDEVEGELEDSHGTHQPRSGVRYRHWRPAPTAQLGVEALGQPAEVLVLPPKSRKDRTSKEDIQEDIEDDEMQDAHHDPPILETISGELKAPSKHDIANHMEQIKEQIGQVQGEVHRSTWLNLRSSLVRSFTTRQMSDYVNDEMGRGKQVTYKRFTRTNLAEQIMIDVWKLKDQSRPISESVKRVYSTRHAKLFMANQKKLKMARVLAPNVLLMKTTKGQGVQISGPADAVERTINSLEAYESKVVEVLLPVTPELHAKLSRLKTSQMEPHSLPDDLGALREILLKTRVVARNVNKNQFYWRLQALDDAHAKAFLKQLMLWKDSFTSLEPSLPLLPYPTDEVCSVPVLGDMDHFNTSPWKRYMLKRPTERRKADVSSNFPDDVKESLQSMFLEPSSLPTQGLFPSAIDGASSHVNSMYQAEIGLAAFRHGDFATKNAFETNPVRLKYEEELLDLLLARGTDMTPSTKGESQTTETASKGDNPPASTLLAQIPLLAQFLVHQQLFKTILQTPHSAQSMEREPQDLLRLIYRCSNESHSPVEIFASVGESTIIVKRVACPLSSVSQIIALPHLIADLKVNKITSTNVYQNGVLLEATLAPFMATLARAMKSVTRNEAGELTGLDMLVQFEVSPSERSTIQTQGLVSGEAATARNASRETSYVLSAAEQVKYQLYQTPVNSPFALEHLVFTPLRDSPSLTQREVLRVVEQPLAWQLRSSTNRAIAKENIDNSSGPTDWQPTLIGSKKDMFETFMKAARGTVTALDRFVRKTNQVMIDRNAQAGEEQRLDNTASN